MLQELRRLLACDAQAERSESYQLPNLHTSQDPTADALQLCGVNGVGARRRSACFELARRRAVAYDAVAVGVDELQLPVEVVGSFLGSVERDLRLIVVAGTHGSRMRFARGERGPPVPPENRIDLHAGMVAARAAGALLGEEAKLAITGEL